MSSHKYDDIIDFSRPKSTRHLPMPLENRAAQFAPFAALTGYEEEVMETARITSDEILLTEESKSSLNQILNELNLHLSEKEEVTITYFVPDKKKEGGSYETASGIVKKIDTYQGELIFFSDNMISNGKKIEISRILTIDAPFLS